MAKVNNKVNWEQLAKQLQEALSKEMKQVERLEQAVSELNGMLEDSVDCEFDIRQERKKHHQIVSYLENRLYEEMKKNEQHQLDKSEIPF